MPFGSDTSWRVFKKSGTIFSLKKKKILIKINTKIFRGATSLYINSCSIVGFLKLNIAQLLKIYDYYNRTTVKDLRLLYETI